MSFTNLANTDTALQSGSDTLRHLSSTFFSLHSILYLVICVGSALILGRIIAFLLRRVVSRIGAQADRSQNLHTVNRLRRYETVIVLSIAVIRTFLLLFSLYFWWVLNHPHGQPTALIGASALLALLISGSLSSPLRDLAAGSLMMAEQWYGVGDHIRIEPFADLQGVVERVTLRSTKVRGLNGEIIWVNNQNIQGVRITPKGIRTIALEIFVTDLAAGERLVKETNRRLPTGQLLLVTPLTVIEEVEVGENLWHITAIGETAPGREWLIEKSAVELIKSLDESRQHQVIAHGPLARYADPEAERRFRRTITNARKRPAPKRLIRKKPVNQRPPRTVS